MAKHENVDVDGSAPRFCDAIALRDPMVIHRPNGTEESGRPGDYLVAFADGTQGIVTAGTFHHVYTPYVPRSISVPVVVHLRVDSVVSIAGGR